MSKKLLKWSIKLSQFDITYLPRRALHGQTLAYFISEFTTSDDYPKNSGEPSNRWRMYTDGTSNNQFSNVGVALMTLEERTISYALKLNFPATNNEAKYEALALKLARKLGVETLHILCDHWLVVY